MVCGAGAVDCRPWCRLLLYVVLVLMIGELRTHTGEGGMLLRCVC